MQRGDALTDSDRWPWLIRVADAMKISDSPVIVSCSALRRVYRQCLLDNVSEPIGFIHLNTTQEIIGQRISNRDGHFMPVSLLESQFESLELLANDEEGVVVDIDCSIEEVVVDAMRYIDRKRVISPY